MSHGISAALFGDTVQVLKGVYNENITLVNGVSLIGAGADNCIINESIPEFKAADSCTIKGFTFNQTITCMSYSPSFRQREKQLY